MCAELRENAESFLNELRTLSVQSAILHTFHSKPRPFWLEQRPNSDVGSYRPHPYCEPWQDEPGNGFCGPWTRRHGKSWERCFRRFLSQNDRPLAQTLPWRLTYRELARSSPKTSSSHIALRENTIFGVVHTSVTTRVSETQRYRLDNVADHYLRVEYKLHLAQLTSRKAFMTPIQVKMIGIPRFSKQALFSSSSRA